MRDAAGRAVAIRTGAAEAFTVVREDATALRDAPLHRFLRIHPAADAAAALEAFRPHGRHLAAVALAGFGEGEARLATALRALGASRVCAPGSLQTPPLAWPRDGLPVLASLAVASGPGPGTRSASAAPTRG